MSPATFIQEQHLVEIRGGWFDKASHTYLDAKMQRVPGVTHTLESAGLVCYQHIPTAVLSHKADVGAAAHAATHYYDEGDLEITTVDEEVMGYLEGWMKFRRETKVEIHSCEQRGIVLLDGMPYGGTFDRDVTLSGARTLIEIKCTAGVEISWGPQTAAYEIGLRAIDGKVRRRVAVHLKPDGTYSLVPLADVKDYQVWKWALALEIWKQTKGKGYGYGSNHIGR
jgi:hypothetical protein